MENKFLTFAIKKYNKLFSKTDKQISEYMLRNGNDLTDKTLSVLSKEMGVSEASIYNFVKKIGFNGFQDFKIQLARNSNAEEQNKQLTAYSDISKEDSPIEIAQKVTYSNVKSLKQLMSDIDEDTLNMSIKMVNQSKALHFFGQGASSVVAMDSYHKFMRSQKYCNYISDFHMQLTYATKLGKNDCVFLFSHSGETIETIQLARILRKNNVNIISLTGNPGSELIELSDASFIIYSAESVFRTETHTARILYLTIMDILVVTTMYKEEENISSIKNIRDALDVSKVNKKKIT